MNILFLPIEIKSRELIPKIFLISRALKKNINCFIGDKIAVNRAVRYFKKGVYFHKSISKYDAKYILDIKSKVDKYVSLDEEIGFAISNKKEFNNYLNFRSSPENVRNVDRVYTWGNFDYTSWKNKYSKFKNKFIISGAPRIDIWNKKVYSSLFKNDILELNNKYGEFIFIPSTFVSSKKKLKEAISLEKKLSPKNIKKKKISSIIHEHNLFNEFIKLTKKISKDFPSINIVIKPHPTEQSEDWKNKFLNYENVNIDNNFDLTAYIAASKLVIFNSSTAGIQSVLMQKKTICYSSISKKNSLRQFPNKFGQLCKNYSQVKNILNKKLKNNFFLDKKKIRERIFISSNFSSDIILKDLISNLKIKKNSKKRGLILFRINSFLFFIYDLIKKLNFVKNNKSRKSYTLLSMSHKLGGGIKKKELTNNLNNLNSFDFNILRYGKNGYFIYK